MTLMATFLVPRVRSLGMAFKDTAIAMEVPRGSTKGGEVGSIVGTQSKKSIGLAGPTRRMRRAIGQPSSWL